MGRRSANPVNPLPGTQVQTRGRFLSAVTTRQKVEWPSGSDITELICFVTIDGAVVSTTHGIYAAIAIDAASDAVADALLTQAPSSTDDAGWIPIPIGELVRIPLTSALENGSLNGGRVDIIGIGDGIDIWIGGN